MSDGYLGSPTHRRQASHVSTSSPSDGSHGLGPSIADAVVALPVRAMYPLHVIRGPALPKGFVSFDSRLALKKLNTTVPALFPCGCQSDSFA